MLDLNQIKTFNQTDAEYDSNLCIFNKLETFAKNTPNEIALEFNNVTYSYNELNNQSNLLANLLIRKGIKIEDFVIVCLDRSIELMVSIFGILKAGGVYVPVLPNYPNDRKNIIFEETSPKIVITTKEIAKNLNYNLQFVFIEDLLETDFKNSDNPKVNVLPTNLAYVIYTSGSTGRPKGVMIEHHSVMNRIGWMQKEYPITSVDVLIQKTSITFDVSVWELFWWSFVGAKLVILPPNDEKSPKKLIECIEKNNVTIIHFVPSMFNTFLSYLKSVYPQNNIQSINYIFCSGEELHQNTVSDFYDLDQKYDNNSTVINLYGPTEATVDVTYYTCPRNLEKIIPIGKPIDNTQIYIINDKHEILPPNSSGELVICGVNLARGYLKQEELTAQKFVELNIFGKNVRSYKTGDLAYFNDDGNIIFQGRIDRQIKLRGFRIELEEIENTLLGLNEIIECCCILNNDKEQNAHIACFYVSKSEQLTNGQIKDFLIRKVPDYMVPAVFCKIEELPLSINGKIDRNQLLKLLELKEKKEIIAHVSHYEKTLQVLWSKLFKKQHINPDINFFDLGGNSLMLVQLSILLKKEFNKDIDVFIIIQNPTIRTLAKYFFDNNN